MNDLPFNIADAAVAGVILITALICLFLGFVRVILALAGWVGAVFVTIYGINFVKPFVREWISTTYIADALSGVGLFIVTLLILTIISHAIAGRVRHSGLGALDRSLGLLLGLALGAALISLSYIALGWVVPAKDQPQWVTSAKTLPLIREGAALLQTFVPGQDSETDRGRNGAEAERALRQLVAPKTKNTAAPRKPGYQKGERREMNRLIESEQ